MEYLRDSFDTGQIEDGLSNSKSIKGYRSSYFLPDPEQHESSYSMGSWGETFAASTHQEGKHK